MGLPCSGVTNGSVLLRGSSGNTSMAAPARWPSSRCWARAGISTTVPREALSRMAPRFMAESARALIRPRVCGVAGTCSVTTSACASASSSVWAGMAEPSERRGRMS
ncbi:hypothetical protein D3C81_1713570 [compost metagenome]